MKKIVLRLLFMSVISMAALAGDGGGGGGGAPEAGGYTVERVLAGHTGFVNSVATLPDGGIVSGSYDGTIRLWDSDTGEQVMLFDAYPPEPVWSVAALSNSRIVSASSDRTVRLWNSDTGELLATLRGHTDTVWSVAVLPNGRIVSGSDDRTVRVWDPDTGEQVMLFEGHTNAVVSVTTLSNGRIVSGSFDRTVRVWDPETGEQVMLFEGHTDAVNSVAALSNGRIISGSADGTTQVFDQDTGTLLTTLRSRFKVLSVAALSNGGIISGLGDSCIRVWLQLAPEVQVAPEEIPQEDDNSIEHLYPGQIAFKSSDELKRDLGNQVKDVYRFDLTGIVSVADLEAVLRRKMNIEDDQYRFDFRTFDQGAKRKNMSAENPGDVVDWEDLQLSSVGAPWVIVSPRRDEALEGQ